MSIFVSVKGDAEGEDKTEYLLQKKGRGGKHGSIKCGGERKGHKRVRRSDDREMEGDCTEKEK